MTENAERTFFEKLADGDGWQLPTNGMMHAVHIGEALPAAMAAIDQWVADKRIFA